MSRLTGCALAVGFLCVWTSLAPVAAQSRPGAITNQEAGSLAEIWVLLANGHAAEASARAAILLSTQPRNAAVLAVAIEADMARAGAVAGLDRYEGTLGKFALEEPALLGRVAQVLLREMAADARNPTAGLEALRVLARHGDAQAMTTLSQASASGNVAQTRVLAEAGDERAVERVVQSLDAGTSNPLEAIRVLGQSGNRAAYGALARQARASEPAVRQAAVEALGQLGDPQAVSLLRTALKDPSGIVQGKAAAALYRLGDNSGIDIIRELAADKEPAVRLAAANYMAGRPDAAWLDLVRSLARENSPEVRLGAARLLAERDPAAADAVLSALTADASVDLALREEAARIQPLAASNDLVKLRGMLRNANRLVRVAAADRVLQVTR